MKLLNLKNLRTGDTICMVNLISNGKPIGYSVDAGKPFQVAAINMPFIYTNLKDRAVINTNEYTFQRVSVAAQRAYEKFAKK